MSNSVFVEFHLMSSVALNRCPYRTFLSLGNRKKSHGARSGEYSGCCNLAVKCVRAYCRGAGSSRHPAIFPVGKLVHANVARPPRRIPCSLFPRRERTRGVRYPQNQKTPVT